MHFQASHIEDTSLFLTHHSSTNPKSEDMNDYPSFSSFRVSLPHPRTGHQTARWQVRVDTVYLLWSVRVKWWNGDEVAWSVKSLRMAYSRTACSPSAYELFLRHWRNVLNISVMCLRRLRWHFSGVRKRLSRSAGKPVWERGKVCSGMRKELFRDKGMPQRADRQ